MDDVVLTMEQELKIVEFWNSRKEPPEIKDIAKEIFGEEFDGRSKQGSAIRNFLASRNLKSKNVGEYKVKDFKLSEDQITFITNNVSTMSVMEIANSLFPDRKLTPLHIEVRAISTLIKSFPSSTVYNAKDLEDNKEYKGPKTIDQAIYRVNKYINNAIDPKKITHKVKQDLLMLINYLNSFRLKYVVDSFEENSDRELFESSFIGYTWDKPDLTAEEVDSYINLSLDIVNLANTQKQINKLTKMLNDTADDSEGKKISMSLAETIHNAQTEYHQNKTRQQKLAEALQGKRSERINAQIKSNASILNLVSLWREEGERKKLIKYAKFQQDKLVEEIDRLTSLDDLKCKIFGISKEEIITQPSDE